MLPDKLPGVGTTIFTRMSALASACGALNLSQGFPDFDPPSALLDALSRRVHAGCNQYAPMPGLARLREQIAGQVARFRDVQCDPEAEITVVPGATAGLFCAVMAGVQAQDEVIVLDPCYDSYEPAIRLAGGRAVHVPLQVGTFSVDWERVARAVTARTRMIIINSPHNPSGSVLGAEDLAALSELAERHDLLIVSDEVYEHLVFDGAVHHSVLQVPALRERSFAVFSFGKTYSVTGWKTGYCIAPPEFTANLRKVHQFVCFVAVTPIQHALADFMEAQPDYPASLAAFYQARRDLFCASLAGSRFRLTPSAGTYFQLVDYSAVTTMADTDLAAVWTRDHGVASIPISPFYEEPPLQHVLRFCFAKGEDVLRQAAERLCAISL